MKIRILLICFLCTFIQFSTFAQGLKLNGARLVVKSGSYVVVSGNVIVEADEGITLDGTLQLQGDLINKSSGGYLFYSPDDNGQIVFSGTSPQHIDGDGRPIEIEYFTVKSGAHVVLDDHQTLITYDDILIETGGVWELLQGAVIKFASYAGVHVQGQLLATGQPWDSVYFSMTDTTGFYDVNTTNGAWAGINFNSTSASNDTSIIDHCVIQFAKAIAGASQDQRGGGLYVENFSKLIISNTNFAHNKAYDAGGAIAYVYSHPKTKNIICSDNESDKGGAIYAQDDNLLKIVNSHLSNNMANNGGAVYINLGQPNLTGNQITNNTAVSGGGIYVNAASPKLINNTIANNEGTSQGGGLSCYSSSSPVNTNNIIWGNDSPLGPQVYLDNVNDEPSFDYCNVQGANDNFGGTGSGGNYTFDYTNHFNIDATPKFMDSTADAGVDYDGLMADWGLLDFSPCINKGTPDTTGLHLPPIDAHQNPRVIADTVEIGAMEFKPWVTEFCGPITNDTVWAADTIRIGCDITVPINTTLTIHKGTVVKFLGYYKLDIQGRLMALGEPWDSITFMVEDTLGLSNITNTNGAWAGIRFNLPTHSLNTEMDHCRILYAKKIEQAGTVPEDEYGAGLFIYTPSHVTIKNSEIRHCHTANKGGGMYIQDAMIHMKELVVSHNTAVLDGGGIFTDGVMMSDLHGSKIANNVSVTGSGGGLYMQNNSQMKISNCDFGGNISLVNGGAIYLNQSSPAIMGTIIADNQAANGAGIYLGSNCNSNLFNNTISRNNSAFGGGLYINTGSSPDVRNTILWENHAATAAQGDQVFLFDGTNNPSFSFCILQGDTTVFGKGSAFDLNWMNYVKTITMDPMFQDPNNHDYHILDLSPAINTGTPDTTGMGLPEIDITTNERISTVRRQIIDIGAIEFEGYPGYVNFNRDVEQNDIIYSSYGPEDTVRVFNDIFIGGAYTLQIQKRAYIQFMGPWHINVQGQIAAYGNFGDTIVFTVADTIGAGNVNVPDGSWGGIHFPSTIGASSELHFCRLEYTKANDFIAGISEPDNGGAIYVDNYSGLLVNRCEFRFNKAKGNGGAIYLNNSSDISIEKSKFHHNRASNGNALFVNNSSPLIRQNAFTQNTNLNNTEGGGAMSIEYSSAKIVNNLFAKNSTNLAGGAIYMFDASPFIINNTFTDNTADAGGALFMNGTCAPDVKNNIIWNNSASQGAQLFFASSSCDPYCSYNTILGDSANFEGPGSGANFEDFLYMDNLDLDPKFVDAANNNYRIQASSPCINTAHPDTFGLDLAAFDIYSNQRIYEGNMPRIDIGAHEYPGEPDAIYFHGNIEENTQWCVDTVHIIGDVYIGSTGILEICPNTVVNFLGYHRFDVHGVLLAEAYEGGEIKFTKSDTTGFYNPETTDGGWAGIRFDLPSEVDTSRFEYVVVEFAKKIDDPIGTDADLRGGGFYIRQASKVKLSHVLVKDNFAAHEGGGAYLFDSNGKIDDCKFENNVSLMKGGGVYIYNSYPLFDGNKIIANKAEMGGGLFMENVFGNRLTRNIISENEAGDGAGIFVDFSNPALYHNIIDNNTAEHKGGAFFVTNNSFPQIINNTIVNNQADSAGAVFVTNTSMPDVRNTIVTHNKAFSNEGEQFFLNENTNQVNLVHCLLESDSAKFGLPSGINFTGMYTKNIVGEAFFTDTTNYDFHLEPNSPAINTGTPDTTGFMIPPVDIEWFPRIKDDTLKIIDIGAYEFHGATPYYNVNRDIMDNQVLPSPYGGQDTICIYNDVDIWSTGTMELHPGAYVQFMGYHKLIVNGRLIAQGTVGDSVTFTSHDTTGFYNNYLRDGAWNGIHFNSPAGDTSKMHFCIVEFAKAVDDVANQDEGDMGGAIYANSCPKLMISDSRFSNNTANTNGGAITLLNSSDINLFKNTFIHNRSFDNGGAIALMNSSPQIINNTIAFNQSQNAAGIFMQNGAPIITGNIIHDNNAVAAGGGVNILSSYPQFNNNTLVENNADLGGGIYFDGSSTPSVHNTLIWGNTSASSGDQVYINTDGSDPDIYNSDIQNGTAGFAGSGSGGAYSGIYIDNISDDPLFVNPAAYDYMLQDNSPCVNAGFADTAGMFLAPLDLNMGQRVKNGTVDIGALEMQNVIAYAGEDQSLCVDYTTLDASPAFPGEGYWDIHTGYADFADGTLHNTDITNIGPGINEFVWTVIDGGSASDTVQIVNNGYTVEFDLTDPVAADMTTVCSDHPTIAAYALDKNLTDITGMVSWDWAVTYGGSVPDAPNSSTTGLVGLDPGINSFEMYSENAGCFYSLAFDVENKAVVALASETVVELCEDQGQLTALTPSSGTGSWTHYAGGGSPVIVNSLDPTSLITNLEPNDNVFRWTVTDDICEGYIDVILANNAITSINAGGDNTICVDPATGHMLGAIDPSPNTGAWTINDQPPVSPVVSFDDNTLPNATISNLVDGIYTLQWTVSNLAGCDESTEIFIENSFYAAEISSLTTTTVCEDNTTLSANTPCPGCTGVWSSSGNTGGGAPEIINPDMPFTDVALNAVGTDFAWTINNDGCITEDYISVTNDAFSVQVDVYDPISTNTLTGLASYTLCSGDFTLIANATSKDGININGSESSWSWTQISGPAIGITSPGSLTTDITGLPSGQSAEFEWNGTFFTCSNIGSVIVTNNSFVVDAGADQFVCIADATLSAITPGGSWENVVSPASVITPLSQVSQATGLQQGENTFRWVVDQLGCQSADTVSVFNDSPSTPVAGPDQNVCTNQVALSGNIPTVGTGKWVDDTYALVSNERETVITLPAEGSYVFKWMITEGSCSAYDMVTVSYDQFTVTAGTSQTVCNASTVVLNGSDPGTGSGNWSLVSGAEPAQIIDPANFITGLISVAQGDNIFKWEVTNAQGCTNFATVEVQNDSLTTNAGPDQLACFTNTVTLAATDPSPSLGNWFCATATVTSPTDPFSTVTGLSPGPNILVWTVTDGSCTNVDEVTISAYAPTVATATKNVGTACDAGDFILTGNTPVVGVGSWSLISGAGSPISPANTKTSISGLAFGDNTFAWTIDDNGCTSTAEITVNYDNITASAGGDQIVCADTVVLTGSDNSGAAGTWLSNSIVEILSPSNPTTIVRQLDPDVNSFTWRIETNSCTSEDGVLITNAKVYATVKDDTTVCEPQVILYATSSTGTGSWSASAPAVLFLPNQLTTAATNLPDGENVFSFYSANNYCDFTDDVIIMNNTVTSIAGNDTVVCTPDVNLNANFPSQGTGTWSTNAALSINNINDPKATISGLTSEPQLLTWTVQLEECIASSEVNVTNAAVEAVAVEYFTVCDDFVDMEAVLPDGTEGTWKLHSGQGTIEEIYNPSTKISGLAPGENIFTWKVYNQYCFDTINVYVYNRKIVADAGLNDTLCVIDYKLSAQIIGEGTGEWSTTGSAQINAPNDPASNVALGLASNEFIWQVSNASCDDADTVLILNKTVEANAADDKIICFPNTFLNADAPVNGTGKWTTASNVMIENPDNSMSLVSEIQPGQHTFTWTVSNDVCQKSDDLVITNYQVTAEAGENVFICKDKMNLNATQPVEGAAGKWSIEAGGGVVETNDYNAVYSNIAIATNRLIWTVTRNKCSASDVVLVENNMVIASTDKNRIICTDTAHLNATVIGAGLGEWKIDKGEGVILQPSVKSTQVHFIPNGSHTYTYYFANGFCSDTATVTIDNNMVTAFAESDREICDDTTTVKATVPEYGAGQWSAPLPISIPEPDEVNALAIDIPNGTHKFKWKVVNTICMDSVFVNITNNMVDAKVAGDFDVCKNTAPLKADLPNFGTGAWTSLSTATVEISDQDTIATNLILGENDFVWKVTLGSCTDSDTITITNNFVQAEAQKDTIVCDETIKIHGQLPEKGEGNWIAETPLGLDDRYALEVQVSNISPGEYKVFWNVNNETCFSRDTVIVTSHAVEAIAGTEQVICKDSTYLDAELSGDGKGTWALYQGNAEFEDVNDGKTLVRNIQRSENKFVWTVLNEYCSDTDTVTIMNNAFDVIAGADLTVCSGLAIIEAEPNEYGIGAWSTDAEGVGIIHAQSHMSIVNGIQKGHEEFVWTVNHKNCAISDNIIIANKEISAEILFETTDEFTRLFDIATNDNIHRVVWDFADGATSAEFQPTHTFAKAGIYPVCLTIFDDINGCSYMVCEDIKVGETVCNAAFIYVENSTENSVRFVNNSEGVGLSYYWIFGDGKTSAEKDPEHVYSEAGYYEVCLQVSNDDGCESKHCKSVKVGTPACDLKANASFNIYENLEVEFYDISSGLGNVRTWSLGDGAISLDEEFTHKYLDPGYYKVTLTVKDTVQKCISVFNKEIKVGEIPCSARFSYKVKPDNKEVQFLNESSENSTIYTWNFGDGKTSDEKDPLHIYTKDGLYYVKLTVSDELGECIHEFTDKIQVGDIDCNASYSYVYDPIDQAVEFTHTGKGVVDNFNWEFGDGTTTNLKSPKYQYKSPGIYTTSLTVSYTEECIDYHEEVIVVGDIDIDCEADFAYQYIGNNKVRFIDKSVSKGAITQYTWNFGESFEEDDFSKEKNPEYVYLAPGYYNVCLNIKNEFGVPNITCKTVHVPDPENNECYADFVYTVNHTEKKARFSNESIGGNAQYNWDFDDSNTSVLMQPVHQFDEDGYYKVVLEMEVDANGCKDEQMKIVNIGMGQGLYAGFVYFSREQLLKSGGYPADFISSSFGKPARAVWDFGDGAMDSTTLNPTHIYKNPGTYVVCLTLTDTITGQISTECNSVTVGDEENSILTLQTKKADLLVYPNPFNDVTTIHFNIPVATYIELSLYDVLGHKVQALLSHQQSPGLYSYELKKRNLRYGIYYVKLLADQGVISRPVVITQ